MEIEKSYITSKLLFEAVAKCLEKNQQAEFIVTGMSMWPLICHGRDSVVVESVVPEQVKKGDIVLLRVNENRYLLHRVTKAPPDTIETTGDGNCFRDGAFPRSCVAARVAAVTRNGKKIDCNRMPWPLLAQLWMALFPCRKYIFALWFRIRPYIRRP